MYSELYPDGFCCQGTQVKKKDLIKWYDVFIRACNNHSAIVNKTDFFLSQYCFDFELAKYFDQTGYSIAGYAGACWCPFVWWDIDRDDLSDAQTDAARLVEFLTQTPADSDSDSGLIVPDTESILIFFSGSKGFHVGVPIAVFGDEVKPGKEFPGRYKAAALEIARRAGVEIDKSVYDRQRLFRCPNTKHGKTGLYKIPLSYWEVTTALNIAEIRQRAQRPRRLVWVESELDKVDIDAVRYSPAVKPVPGAVALWSEVQADMFSELPSMGGAEREDTEKPIAVQYGACVNRFPDGYEAPRIRRETLDYIQHGAQKGKRAVSLFNAVADCCRCGWNRQAVESLFFDVASQTGLSWAESRKEIEGAIKHGGCNNDKN